MVSEYTVLINFDSKLTHGKGSVSSPLFSVSSFIFEPSLLKKLNNLTSFSSTYFLISVFDFSSAIVVRVVASSFTFFDSYYPELILSAILELLRLMTGWKGATYAL